MRWMAVPCSIAVSPQLANWPATWFRRLFDRTHLTARVRLSGRSWNADAIEEQV